MRKKAAGLQTIKTAQRCKIHAKPKSPDTDYLDLFVLEKNRSRIQQEIEHLQERLKQLKRDITEIDQKKARRRYSRLGEFSQEGIPLDRKED